MLMPSGIMLSVTIKYIVMRHCAKCCYVVKALWESWCMVWLYWESHFCHYVWCHYAWLSLAMHFSL